MTVHPIANPDWDRIMEDDFYDDLQGSSTTSLGVPPPQEQYPSPDGQRGSVARPVRAMPQRARPAGAATTVEPAGPNGAARAADTGRAA